MSVFEQRTELVLNANASTLVVSSRNAKQIQLQVTEGESATARITVSVKQLELICDELKEYILKNHKDA